MDLEGIRKIEELAARVWPAAEVEELDGWLLRFNFGVTRRANSVLPNADSGRLTLAEKLEGAREFYARHNAPLQFQVSPASLPPELDDELERLGLEAVGETCVQTASAAQIAAATSVSPEHTVSAATSLTDEWYIPYASSWSYAPEMAAARREIMSRIRAETAFVQVRIDGDLAAVGLGVYEEGWVGVFAMVTLPEFRRRGAASSILHFLAEWGLQRGAAGMYLLVSADNLRARSVYERAGFTTAYCYHYRVQPRHS